jgi:hypothetical protein
MLSFKNNEMGHPALGSASINTWEIPHDVCGRQPNAGTFTWPAFA